MFYFSDRKYRERSPACAKMIDMIDMIDMDDMDDMVDMIDIIDDIDVRRCSRILHFL